MEPGESGWGWGGGVIGFCGQRSRLQSSTEIEQKASLHHVPGEEPTALTAHKRLDSCLLSIFCPGLGQGGRGGVTVCALLSRDLLEEIYSLSDFTFSLSDIESDSCLLLEGLSISNTCCYTPAFE